MKRLLLLLLAMTLVLVCAACNSESSETSSTTTSSKSSTSSTSSVSSTSSGSVTSDVSSNGGGDSSSDSSETETSDTSTPNGDVEVESFITQYISWKDTIGKGIVSLSATDATSARLTAINKGAVDGTASVIAFNSDYEDSTIASADGTYDDYEIFVFEYDHSLFNYPLTASYGLDAEDKDDIEIPDDGFVVAVHKYFAEIISAIKSAPEDALFYPHGFRGTNDVDAEIKTGTAKIDGSVSKSEYGSPIWEINPDSTYCSYEQFEVNNYYSTAQVYMMYDEDYLYLGVVVDSPYHVNTVTASTAGSMYSYECIQVNVTSVSPASDYIFENWDDDKNKAAVNANIVRQYGFCVNDNDETLSCVWMGTPATFGGEVKCVRDDENQQTIYEVAIPWSECGAADEGISVEKGTEIGVSVSINSGDGTFKNIFLRDGGGIIGLNDWTKVPTITLQ